MFLNDPALLLYYYALLTMKIEALEREGRMRTYYCWHMLLLMVSFAALDSTQKEPAKTQLEQEKLLDAISETVLEAYPVEDWFTTYHELLEERGALALIPKNNLKRADLGLRIIKLFVLFPERLVIEIKRDALLEELLQKNSVSYDQGGGTVATLRALAQELGDKKTVVALENTIKQAQNTVQEELEPGEHHA